MGSLTHAQSLSPDSTPKLPKVKHSSLEKIEEVLRPQISNLEKASVKSGTTKATIQLAQRTFRRVVIELTQRAREKNQGSICAGLIAERLANSVRGIDSIFNALDQPSVFTGSPPQLLTNQMRQRAIAKLTSFSSSGLELMRRSNMRTPEEIDSTLATVLAPIVEIITIVEHRIPLDRWPTQREVAMGLREPIDHIESLTGDSPLTQADQRLIKALAFPELAGNATNLRILLHQASDSEQRILDAGFTPDMATKVHALVLNGATKSMRTEDWEEAADTFRLAQSAVLAAQAIQRLQTTAYSQELPPELLQQIWSKSLDAPSIDDSAILLSRTRLLVEIMEDARLGEQEVLRDLTSALRSIEKRRQRLKRKLLTQLPSIAAEPTALSTNELSSLIAAMKSTHDDEVRIRNATRQVRRITDLRPSSTREFTRRVREWCRMLSQTGNRTKGADALDQVSLSFERYDPIPFESRLRTADPQAQILTGGRAVDLVQRIDLLRTEWADEIAQGELNGPRGKELDLLARLGRLLSDLEVVAEEQSQVREAVAVTNRWGGWYVPEHAIEWMARSIAPGLKIAVAAALQGNLDQLQSDLNRLEDQAPPVRLLGWLASQLNGPLEGTIDGPAGAIIASALPASREAWLINHRIVLASICRALLERSHANRQEDIDEVTALTNFIVHSSRQLLQDLGVQNP